MKAEGGWGVCTEYSSIPPSSDDLPHPSASLLDDNDIRAHALMTGKVHAQGALAGAEFWAVDYSVPDLHDPVRRVVVKRNTEVLEILYGYPIAPLLPCIQLCPEVVTDFGPEFCVIHA